MKDSTCTRPPKGWECSRPAGHEGPCAARRQKPRALPGPTLADLAGILLFLGLVALTLWLLASCAAADRDFRSKVSSVGLQGSSTQEVDGTTSETGGLTITFRDPAGLRKYPPVPIVKASSFADPADVAAFRHCKAAGGSDERCFKVGDNGVGAWGHDCAQETHPMAALPREIWRGAGKRGGARLAVTYRGVRVEGILGDTMPALAHITNGAGIDLNPAFAKALGAKPPFMLPGVQWEWL